MAQWRDSIVDTYIQVWNGADPDLLNGVAAANVVRTAGSLETTNVDNVDALKTAITGFRETFPDTIITIKERLHGEDSSMLLWEFKGTNTGPGEFSPTGKPASVTGMTLMRYRDGKMSEEHVYYDHLGFMKQLGLA